MRAHYLQHVPFEGLGSIDPWLRSSGAEVTGTKFFENPTLPNVNDIDLLVIMGGPMSVNDEAGLPWLVTEKQLIRAAIEKERAVVGICLGAQLIASAMGAPVYPNKEKEIGWFPVSRVLANDPWELFSFPAELLVFHWHGETFDLPRGATRLAHSITCGNQAFQLNRRVIGLQFHLETTPESARDIALNCRSELVPSRYIQSETQILAADASTYGAINSLMGEALKFVTRQ
ncbi:MAG: type 1 glutamine amidotransferase [Gammaproteobacteria bacterium]